MNRPLLTILCGLTLILAFAPASCGKKRGDASTAPPGPNMEGGSGVRPRPETVGSSPDDPPTIQNTADSQRVRVWFGTNRSFVDAKDPTSGFANERDPDSDALHLGSVVCDVPNARPMGSTGSSWLTRLATGEDDRITITQVILNDEETYFRQIAERLAAAPMRERAILVYVHGYKNSFESAALRAAQLAVDLRVPGLTAFYSWPSRDMVGEYAADEAAVETAEKHLRHFLLRMAKDTSASEVHLIAHSMGNRVVTRVMHRLLTDPDAKMADGSPLKFGQIILAAPDIDQQVFGDLAVAYPKLSRRTTLYVSQRDKALEASSWTHSFPRTGYAPPVVTLPPIDTIEVTGVDVSVLGHGYVAEAEQVLRDVAGLLRADAPPSERKGLKAAKTEAGKGFWVIE